MERPKRLSSMFSPYSRARILTLTLSLPPTSVSLIFQMEPNADIQQLLDKLCLQLSQDILTQLLLVKPNPEAAEPSKPSQPL